MVTRGEMENLVIDFSNSIVNINSWDYLEFYKCTFVQFYTQVLPLEFKGGLYDAAKNSDCISVRSVIT